MKNLEKIEEKPVKLDLKDKKILFEIDFDARMPYSKLAKKVGLSKQGAEYKINNLIKKGVIKGFYPVINVPRLGFIYCRLSITLQNMTKEKYDELIYSLQKNNKVFWLFRMHGMHDLFFVIWTENLTEFRNFVEDFEGKFGKYIKGKKESIATDVIHYQHRYLLQNEKTDEIHLKESREDENVDELDKKILALLCNDARTSLVDMARKIKESPKVIAYRIKRLEERKIILGYRPIIDHNKIGYTYYKIFINLNNITKQDLAKIKEYIKSNPNVIYLIEGIGLHADIDIEMMIRTNKELFDFIEDLRFRFPTLIDEYETVIFMETLKVRYLPF